MRNQVFKFTMPYDAYRMLRVESHRTGRAMTEVLRGWIANYLDGKGHSHFRQELQQSNSTTVVENNPEPAASIPVGFRASFRMPTTEEMQQFAPHFDWSLPKSDWSKDQHNAFFDKRDEINATLEETT